MALGNKINQILQEEKKSNTNNTQINQKINQNSVQEEEEEDCNTCELLGVTDKKNQMFSMVSSSISFGNDGTISTNTTKITNKDKESNKDKDNEDKNYWLPLDKPATTIELGNSGWTLLHTMAAYYPDKPSENRKQDTLDFLTSFSKVYPCKVCAKDFREIIKDSPPKLDSQKEFALWLCDAHNSVNTQLGKPKFDCDLLNERWKLGSKFH